MSISTLSPNKIYSNLQNCFLTEKCPFILKPFNKSNNFLRRPREVLFIIVFSLLSNVPSSVVIASTFTDQKPITQELSIRQQIIRGTENILTMLGNKNLQMSPEAGRILSNIQNAAK